MWRCIAFNLRGSKERLAIEVTSLVHGRKAAEEARDTSHALLRLSRLFQDQPQRPSTSWRSIAKLISMLPG